MTPQELEAYLASLPVDDEPLTPEELAAIEAGQDALARGDVVSAAEIARLVDEVAAKAS